MSDSTHSTQPNQPAASLPDGFKLRVQPAQIRGLGDIAAAVAQPIAKAIDAIAGTDLQNCGGCKDRQEAMNNLLPFGKD